MLHRNQPPALSSERSSAKSRRPWLPTLLTLLVGVVSACTAGQGEGKVQSERLYIDGCWDGPFDLQPTFFGANPHRQESLLIRVQRGDNLEEVSDGLIVLVNDIATIRDELLNIPIEVNLPPGVSPPGVPLTGKKPPLVSLALYLHDTCHRQNSAVFSIGGTITFHSLFSGDPNERRGDDRFTDANFSATFADPRVGTEPEQTSLVTGQFRFFFQRGQPAQPFS